MKLHEILHEIAAAAGYEQGDNYTAHGIIKALKYQERTECAIIAGKQSGYVSCNESFSRGYEKGREDAMKEIQARVTEI